MMAFVSRFGADRRLRFLLAGGLAAAVNWLVRFPLSLIMPFAMAVLTATAVGMAFGFLAYRAFVFTGSTRPWAWQLRDFILVNIVGAALTAIVAVVARDVLLWTLGAPLEAAAHAIGIAAGAVGNYFGHKSITFRVR